MIRQLSDSPQQTGRLDAESEGSYLNIQHFKRAFQFPVSFGTLLNWRALLCRHLPGLSRSLASAVVRSNYAARRPGPASPARQKAPPAQAPDTQLSARALHLPTPKATG